VSDERVHQRAVKNGPRPLTSSWLIPALGYIVAVGALGVTSKLALRTLSWQELLLWATVGYVLTTTALLLMGEVGFHWETNSWWALASAVAVNGGLVFLYLALGAGEASKVIPVTAAYPALTLLLSALFLAEHVSAAKVGGMLLVVGGVVVLTISK
jgi:transporter family protein